MDPSAQLAHDFVQTHPLAVLATINQQGTPETAAVYCVLDEDLALYFLSPSRTRKLKNIDRQPAVSLTFLDEADQRTLQVQGTGVVIETAVEAIYFKDFPATVAEALLKLDSPAFKTGGATHFFVKITPHWMRLADFQAPGKDPSSIYTMIIGWDW